MGTVRLVFRADASPEMGAGHVMRCLAIAEEASDRDIDCVFLGQITGVDWVLERVTNSVFSRIYDPKTFHPNKSEDILVLDSYHLPVNNLFIQPEHWFRIVSIIDEVTPEYFSDLKIHPGLNGSWLQGRCENFLYGPKYIPFRKSISRRLSPARKVVENILVVGGGTDPFKFTTNIAAVLSEFENFTSATFFSNNKVEIERIDPRFTVKNLGPALDLDVESADIVFTTASTASLEFVAQGIPVGVACAVTNQQENFDLIKELNIGSTIGRRQFGTSWQFNKEEIEKMLSGLSHRLSLINKGKDFIDFQGSSRIVDAILKLSSVQN